MKVPGLMWLLVGISSVAIATDSGGAVPEIAGTSAASALALASGAFLLMRSRRSRQ